MKQSIYVLAFTALVFTSCKNNTSTATDNQEQKTEATSEKASKTPVEKAEGISPIIASYLQLKNALVADNSQDAAKAGTTIIAAFDGFDASVLSEEQQKEYHDIVENAREQAEHIIANADKMHHQRVHFETISKDFTDLIAIIGTDRPLYQDFCPMYNNNKGGYWISEIKDIKNPFFGSEMMTCGILKKEI